MGLPETQAGASEHPSSEHEEGEEEEEDGEEMEAPQPLQVVDVHDTVSRRRGRPKKRESVIERFRRNRHCILCGQPHPIARCDHYQEFAAAVEHNEEEVEDTGHHRCSVCSAIGHNRKTCPWVHKSLR